MSDRSRLVPDPVSRAAAEVWKKWDSQIAAAVSGPATNGFDSHSGSSEAETWKTPEERMIDKIRRRMAQYPEWYETDSAKLADTVCRELERIGATLARSLPRTHAAVEVWQVPLSVFNWLVEEGEGVRFIRGALGAWSDAQDFNGANVAGIDHGVAQQRRAAFLDIAPPLLKAVLGQLMDHGFWITFGQKYTGPEFTGLIMRVQREQRDR